MRFKMNYTSPTAFRQPIGETQGKGDNGMTRRICRPQKSSLAPITRDPMKLCRWTPNHREQRTKHSIKGENSLKEIGPLTHCKVSDHLFVVGRNNSIKNGENWLSGVTVVSRHVGVNWKNYCARP